MGAFEAKQIPDGRVNEWYGIDDNLGTDGIGWPGSVDELAGIFGKEVVSV